MAAATLSAPWRHRLFDFMISGAIGFLTLNSAVFMGYEGLRGGLGHLAIGGTMAAALLLRRDAPLAVMAVVSTAALAQVIVGLDPQVYDVAVVVAMVAVVIHADALWKGLLAGGVTLLGHLVAAADVGLLDLDVNNYPGYVFTATTMAVTVAVWLGAYVRRTRRLYLATLEERAATAERERDHLAKLAAADERAGIARELHDVVAHSLAVMIVQADGAGYALDSDRERARNALRTIANTGRDALEDMRRIVNLLRGTGATGADESGAADGRAGGAGDADGDRRRVGLDQLEPLVDRARSAGLAVDLRITGDPARMSPPDELTIFRLTQECLTNTLRHAGVDAKVTITLAVDHRAAVLEVVDDGAGRLSTPAHPAARSPEENGGPPRSPGHGLIGMRERVAAHGGEFTAGPRMGTGWQVRAVIPLRPAGPAVGLVDPEKVAR